MRQRSFELSAWLILEMGKNRIEALGEIEELADLIDYYNEQMRANEGYVRAMASLGPSDKNTSVLRPYGVWAVIAPWNFPYALLGAPVAAALLTGNTVVAKPSSDTPLSGVMVAEIFQQAGLPPGTLQPDHRQRAGRRAAAARPSRPPGHHLHRLLSRSGFTTSIRSSPGASPGPASSRWAARTRPS